MISFKGTQFPKDVILFAVFFDEERGIVTEDSYIWQVRGERVDGALVVSVVLLGLRENLGSLEASAETFRRMISTELGEEIVLTLEIIPIDVVHHVARPSGPSATPER